VGSSGAAQAAAYNFAPSSYWFVILIKEIA